MELRLTVLRVSTISHQALWRMANRWRALAGNLPAMESRLAHAPFVGCFCVFLCCISRLDLNDLYCVLQGTADPTELARVRAELDAARSMIQAQDLGIICRDQELKRREDGLRSRDAEIASLRAQLATTKDLLVTMEYETLESSPERGPEQEVVSALPATPRETETGPPAGVE